MNVSDIVRVKSGGPDMTISEVRSDNYAVCYWFDEKNVRQIHAFPLAVLELVDQTTEPAQIRDVYPRGGSRLSVY